MPTSREASTRRPVKRGSARAGSTASSRRETAVPVRDEPPEPSSPPPASNDTPRARRGASLTEQAYVKLRQKIIDSELIPGSYLLEQELVLMLGLSRTPVREAAVRLESEGLVQIVPRHGVRIVPTSISDIKNIYEVLISLESTAAELLATRAQVDLSPLDTACRDMSDALEHGDMSAWVAADEVFHETLVKLGGNSRLLQVVMNCRDQVHRVRRFTQKLKPHPQPRESIAEHHAILDAIRHGDAARVGTLYRAHRERGWHEQMSVLQQYGIQQA